MASFGCFNVRKAVSRFWFAGMAAGFLLFMTHVYFTVQNSSSGVKNSEGSIPKKVGRLKGPLDAADENVIKTLREEYLRPPSSLPYNLSTNESYKKRAVGYTWGFVNDILKDLFDEDDGASRFFVEAGGLDGEFLSNTLWLEKSKSWTGLVVEPEPRNYQEMIYKRRKCWIAKSCLSTVSFPKQAVMVSVETNKNQNNLDAEAIRGGTHEVGSHLSDNHYSEIEKDFIKYNFISQCFPLYSFLLALNQTVIDFLSLDIQGTEVDVFNTIPLDKIYIRTFVIEYETDTFSTDLVTMMNDKGFHVLSVGGSPDYFFVNSQEKELIKKYKGKDLQSFANKGYQFTFTD